MCNKTASIDTLISIFDEFLDENDIISSLILSQISSKIVKYRLDKKMTQTEFAKFLEVSQSMISKIESSDYNYTIKNLVKLCNKMNLSLNITIEDKQRQTSSSTYFFLSHYDKEPVTFKSVNYHKNIYAKNMKSEKSYSSLN